MPTFIDPAPRGYAYGRPSLRDESFSYAEEDELLAFANAVREAGGADVLEALMPSGTGASTCLIATALNFTCEIAPVRAHDGIAERWESGAWKWGMYVKPAVAEQVVAALDLEQRDALRPPGRRVIVLPERIGNAARAYDLREGWTTQYRSVFV